MQSEELLQVPAGGEESGKKKESPLVSLEADLKYYAESIKEVSAEIINELEEKPLFIAHQHEVKLGETILDREELGTQWSINAATLTDFIEKGIIKPERKEAFLASYKNPQKFMCLFVVVPEGANFVYYPYPEA